MMYISPSAYMDKFHTVKGEMNELKKSFIIGFITVIYGNKHFWTRG